MTLYTVTIKPLRTANTKNIVKHATGKVSLAITMFLIGIHLCSVYGGKVTMQTDSSNEDACLVYLDTVHIMTIFIEETPTSASNKLAVEI